MSTHAYSTGFETAERTKCPSHRYGRVALLVLSSLLSGIALAQVPPNIEAGLRKIGPIVDPACTAELYRPLMPGNDITSHATPLYPGVKILRNQAFGPDPDDVVDIFVGDKGTASRTVFIFVPGGGGNKIEIQSKAANAFYDNIGRWATKHGMIGVTMQRHPGGSWDAPAKDVSAMIQWLQSHIGQYHGNPDRMFIMAHSAGNYPLGTYVGRPELYGPKGLGVVGVIFVSPAPFDIAPVQVARPYGNYSGIGLLALGGKACGAGGPMSSAGALPGVAPGHPGGPPPTPASGGPRGSAVSGEGAQVRGTGGAAAGFGAPVAPAVALARSSLPALEKTSARIMLMNGELDPAANGGPMPFVKALHDTLCGAGRCPTLVIAKGESHMSMVFSIDTSDQNVSGPLLRFIHDTP
jgi:hypothetical protein